MQKNKKILLPNLIGKFGSNKILLDYDIDLSSNLGEDGYKIAKILKKNQFVYLKEAVKNFIKNALVSSLGNTIFCDMERKYGKFKIENYHMFASDEKIHSKVLAYTRAGIDFGDKRYDLGFRKSFLENSLSKILGHEVELYYNLEIRIVRPNSTDNNPLHRDCYLDHLRNKINVYLPIAGSNLKSSLCLIPGSHRLSESKISRTQNGATVNGRKFTVPAIVEVKNTKLNLIRVSPKYGEINVFSPYLIHGGGSNQGKNTRCSLEIRFYKKDCLEKKYKNDISSFGLGTIWYSCSWPQKNKNWVAPKVNSILQNQIYPIINLSKKKIIFDTAPSYGNSEKILGNIIQKLTLKQKNKVIVASKVGSYINGEIDFSTKRIHKSLKNSYKLLGKVDIIYLHITSKLSLDEALKIIESRDLYYEMLAIKKLNKYGCKKLGITISNVELLKKIIDKNLIALFDVLQISSYIVRENLNLLLKWKARNKNNLIVVNSVIRHKPDKMTNTMAYESIICCSNIDVILCGSNKPIISKLKLFKELNREI